MRHASPRLVLGLALGATVAVSVSACADRTYLTASHGRSVTRAIAVQTANPEAAKNPRPLPAFDAQEASIVARGYRQSLAPKSAGPTDDKGMVILAPSAAGAAQPYLPPPSVPEHK
jgi:hypothetical protein